MILCEQVIHPGWVTKSFEDEDGVFYCTHTCVTCGYVARPGSSLLAHIRDKHPAQSLNLELYNFKAAIHQRHIVFGLKAFVWPDTAIPNPRDNGREKS